MNKLQINYDGNDAVVVGVTHNR